LARCISPTALEPRSNPDGRRRGREQTARGLARERSRAAQPAQQRGPKRRSDRCLLRPNLKSPSCPSRRFQIPPLVSKLASPLRSVPSSPLHAAALAMAILTESRGSSEDKVYYCSANIPRAPPPRSDPFEGASVRVLVRIRGVWGSISVLVLLDWLGIIYLGRGLIGGDCSAKSILVWLVDATWSRGITYFLLRLTHSFFVCSTRSFSPQFSSVA
jgi:hypothetical protein